jgi:hypothetical protein
MPAIATRKLTSKLIVSNLRTSDTHDASVLDARKVLTTHPSEAVFSKQVRAFPATFLAELSAIPALARAFDCTLLVS